MLPRIRARARIHYVPRAVSQQNSCKVMRARFEPRYLSSNLYAKCLSETCTALRFRGPYMFRKPADLPRKRWMVQVTNDSAISFWSSSSFRMQEEVPVSVNSRRTFLRPWRSPTTPTGNKGISITRTDSLGGIITTYGRPQLSRMTNHRKHALLG